MDPVILYLRNDQVETLVGFKDAETGDYLNDATLTATLLDPELEPVAAFTGLELVYVAASNGNYELTVTADMLLRPIAGTSPVETEDLSAGAGYSLDITQASDPHFHVRLDSKVDYRRS
ncbi:MAG: hypothetical protein M3P27_02925 [Acidobacteriota bacterium]|nr:hypothetical protein [Acidobacteriota bacterium]